MDHIKERGILPLLCATKFYCLRQCTSKRGRRSANQSVRQARILFVTFVTFVPLPSVNPYHIGYVIKCIVCEKKGPKKENVAIKEEKRCHGGGEQHAQEMGMYAAPF